jgi:hypothetical protein
MRLTTAVLAGLGLSAASMPLASCGGDCVLRPCPMPVAITARVIDVATGSPVNGATLRQGPTGTPNPCGPLCYVPGTAGTYVLDVSAPGYQSTRLTVTVEGTNPECGCPTVVAQHLDITLSPAP